MRSSLALGLLLLACAPPVTTPPPEAAPLPAAPPAAPPVVVAPPPPPAPTTSVTRDGHVVSAVRVSGPCPWVEYSTEWKGLRLRSDREGCSAAPLAEQIPIANELIDALARELGDEFEPRSFGMSDYPELYERIARAAATSPAWSGATGRPKKGSAESYVVDLVRDGRTFYPEVFALFEARKLWPELSSVEKVLVTKVADVPNPAALTGLGAKPDAKVPTGSIVWFRLNEP